MDEETLIAHSLYGDLNAYNRLVSPYEELAYNVALRLLNDTEQAAAVVQDSCIQAFRQLAMAPIGGFKLWLISVVVRACRQQMRASRTWSSQGLCATKQVEHGRPSAGEFEGDSHAAVVPPSSVQLSVAMDGLPDEFRVLLVLHDIHGFANSEIAEICGEAVATIRARLGTARRSLQMALLGLADAGALAPGPGSRASVPFNRVRGQ